MLYIRMFFLMIISFITTRIVFRSLGEQDYGLNNAVGGFVALFGVLTSSLNAAISRFLTFEMGRKDQQQLNKVFSTSIIIQIIMAIVVAALIETIGIWFMDRYMTIPYERLNAAHWVLHFAVINTFITLTFIPYRSAIISHEKMEIYAYVSILEGVLQLAIAFMLAKNLYCDNLIFYGGAMCISSFIVNIIYRIYCKIHFTECKLRSAFDKGLLKNIAKFAGWNFFGAISSVFRSQGINLLFNIFFGPAVNAARGVSNQASNVATKFSSGFMTALYPQITKSYASGDYKYMNSLIFQGTRMGFILFFIIALPIFVETEFLLSIWLGDYPAHTIAFIRIALIILFFDQILAGPQTTSLLATGNIRKYQIVTGGILLFTFPLAYVLLKVGFSSEIVMIMVATLSFLAFIVRLGFMVKMIPFPVMEYIREVLFRIISAVLLASIIPVVFHFCFIDVTWFRFLNCLIAVISGGLFSWVIVCTATERAMVMDRISKLKISRHVNNNR